MKNKEKASPSDNQIISISQEEDGKERSRMSVKQMERVEATTKMTSKGQVTVPVELRNALGIKEGDQLRFIMENGVVYVEAVKHLTFEQLCGIFKHEDGPGFVLDMSAAREERAGAIMGKDGDFGGD